MAAFNPVPMLLPMAAEALMPGATGSLGDTLTSREAEAALQRQQAEANAVRGQSAAADMAAIKQNLSRTSQDLTTDLARAQAAERARQAAAGSGGGRSGVALLGSLGDAADLDYARAKEDAQARLKGIQDGLDNARRQDLLALAEQRRQGELARLQASLSTTSQWGGSLFGSSAPTTSRWIRATDFLGPSMQLRNI